MSRSSRSPGQPDRLKRRADFVAAAKGRRHHTPRLTLQAYDRKDGDPAAATARVGFTVTRKVGNAVVRNRVKRRLRAAVAELCASGPGRDAVLPGHDYVIVGRRDSLAAPFAQLVDDLRDGLVAARRPRGASRRSGAPSSARADRSPEST
jgi:ribonuclease P protein component